MLSFSHDSRGYLHTPGDTVCCHPVLPVMCNRLDNTVKSHLSMLMASHGLGRAQADMSLATAVTESCMRLVKSSGSPE